MVSIIVPAYNAEKYIERCIKSVLAQSSHLYELIIINDGSTDQTAAICKQLCKNNDNCIVLEQSNSGVSSARNKGISYAQGEWIVFLDSDDYLEPDYVETVEKYSADCNVDFILFNYTAVGIESERQKEQNYYYTDNRMLIEKLMRYNKNIFCGASLNSPWAKAYRREIIYRSQLQFEEKIDMGEDLLFNLSYYTQVHQFVHIGRDMYHCQVSNNSLSRRFDLNLVQVDREFHQKLSEILTVNKLIEQYENQCKMFALDGYLSCLKRCLFHPKNSTAYMKRVQTAKSMSNSKPYCDALNDTELIRKHCNKKNRILIELVKGGHWRIAEMLIRMAQ